MWAGGWAVHHFIYMQVPLLGILALAVSGMRRGLPVLGSVFAAAAVASLAAIWLVPPPRNASPEIPVVFQAALAVADRETVINCASWGCYYTYSLLNLDDVPVVYAATPRDAGRFADDMRSQGRRILHLCYDCDAESVQQLYPQAGVAPVSTERPSGSSSGCIPRERAHATKNVLDSGGRNVGRRSSRLLEKDSSASTCGRRAAPPRSQPSILDVALRKRDGVRRAVGRLRLANSGG
jgi:hypothetical protein